ncbi:protein kinase [Citricoccus sp.]|uniref:serine/threonine protein kinase n=2 Tax=Citricoccus sp. TaxID=1978372 RepID=UPI002B8222A5|nr:protein kinase [Citricoccus sp.]HRO95184.1 protein kinase [Citricoccus sp.]
MGQVIAGRFELADHIASGGSGSIWAAWDRRREQWCAAKVLRHKDSGELLRFVREQGIQLDHHHLATPYGWAAEDADVAISMPLVAGGTLETALGDHGAFSSALAARMLLQLLDALDHVHHAGWIHRDVKPANILLEPTGEGMPHLRLGDFGIAVREDDPRFTTLGWVNGTPGYLAPEAMDLAAPAPAQDLYAAGVVALRMLDPTVRGERGLEAAALDPRRTLARIEGVDPRLASVVAGLLDEDPGDRVAAAERAPRTLDVLATPQTGTGGYLTAAGEPFAVFRQVEAGGTTGITADRAGFGGTGIPADGVGVGRPADAAPGPGPTAAPGPSADTAPRVPAPPVRTPRVGSPRSTGQAAEAGEDGGDRGRGVGALLPWTMVLLGIVALVVAAVLLRPDGGRAGPGAEQDTGTDQGAVAEPTSRGTGTAPSARSSPASAPEPTSRGTGTAPSGRSSPASAPESPAPSGRSGTPVITSSVRAGDDCTALERGLVVTGADGRRLVCVEDTGGLVWEADD